MSEVNALLGVLVYGDECYKVQVDLKDESYEDLPDDFMGSVAAVVGGKTGNESDDLTEACTCGYESGDESSKDDLFLALLSVIDVDVENAIDVEVTLEEVLAHEGN